MRCAVFVDSEGKVQAAWYDAEKSVSQRVGFSELRARARASAEKACLTYVADPSQRLRAAGYRAGFKDVLFMDPVESAIREWVAEVDETTELATSVVVLRCESDGGLAWEFCVLSSDARIFVVPDESWKASGHFVPTVDGKSQVGLERFVDWFERKDCRHVILTGTGIGSEALTDGLSLLEFLLELKGTTLYRCEHASVLGAVRPVLDSTYRICDAFILAAVSAMEAGAFDEAIKGLKAAEAVFDVPPEAVAELRSNIRSALLNAAETSSDADALVYYQKALLVALPDEVDGTADKDQAFIYARLAYCYCRRGDYVSAEDAALASNFLNPDVYGDVLSEIATHRRENLEAQSRFKSRTRTGTLFSVLFFWLIMGIS